MVGLEGVDTLAVSEGVVEVGEATVTTETSRSPTPGTTAQRTTSKTRQQLTPQGNSIQPTESNDGSQSTHIGWAIWKHVGHLYIAICMPLAVYTLLYEYMPMYVYEATEQLLRQNDHLS